MAKNKQQVAAEARAKKSSTQEVQPAVGTKPGQINGETGKVNEQAPAPTTKVPSKQEQTIAKLKEGWTAKGVDLSKLSIKDDGKFKLVIVAAGWPTCTVGPTGGLGVTELKSYTKAFDAAMIGKELYDKQKAREQKKTAAAAPPAPKAPVAEKQSVSA